MLFPDIDKLKSLVKVAAQEILIKNFGDSEFEYKADGSVVTSVDIAMQTRLERELKQHWPQYAVLGEEMTDAEQQAVIDTSDSYWCIDPLDGSNNYAAGLPFFAVSIALIVDRLQYLGLIYDPVRDEMFTAIKGQGAYMNGSLLAHERLKFREDKPVVAGIDLKRLPEPLAVKLVTEKIYASQRNIGSSTIDWCWISAGRFDIYLHGGQKLWDYAAGSLIFSEAGGRMVSLDNQEVFRNELEQRSVLACFNEDLFNYWYEWIGIEKSA